MENFHKIRYNPKEHCQDVTTIRRVLFMGWFLAVILLCIWVPLYRHYYDREKEDDIDPSSPVHILDAVGIAVIILVGISYWWFLSRQRFGKENKCLSPEITELWPHLAFRYGIGLGVFMPLLSLIPKGHPIAFYHANLQEFFPVLILSMILGSYFFMWLQYIMIDWGNCPSPLLPLKMTI